MSDKRFPEISATATVEDFTSNNYVPMDGNDGAKKIPMDLFKKVNRLGDGGTLTDGSIVTAPNNAVSSLTTSQSSLRIQVVVEPGEIPNFAVEITASADATLTVAKVVSGGGAAVATQLKPSVSGGTELESGKIYQVTCVGSCWTIAEFEDPSAST